MVEKRFASWRHRARRGIAALEFALTLPIWMALLLGVGDGSYFFLASEKTDRIAYTITDIVTQYQTISLANLADIVLAGAQLMQPLPTTITTTGSDTSSRLTIIVSSVYKPTGQNPIVCWQYSGGLVSTSGVGSLIGSPGSSTDCSSGGTATLPNGLTLNNGDNVIIAEVSYRFTPLFVDQFLAQTLYRVAVYKPRLSPLTKKPT